MNDPILVSLERLKTQIISGDLPNILPVILPENAVDIFTSMITSRALDHAGRNLSAMGEGFYTIGSSGHEATAMVANATRMGDPAFLHYRDAAFLIERARMAGHDVLPDMLNSFMASADDPISGGRHKVLGSLALNIPPQTSTIASHLPKAVGTAFSIGLAKQLGMVATFARDAVVVASFGDASLNHASAQAAINTAIWTHSQGAECPIVFVCEDNGIGISTPSPANWVASQISSRAGLRYVYADGRDPLAAVQIQAAVDHARRRRCPVFLHLQTYRYFGHAGSDIEAAYRDKLVIAAELADDPLRRAAARLLAAGMNNLPEIIDQVLASINAQIETMIPVRRLETRADIRASIIPKRDKKSSPRVPQSTEAATMNKLIARGLSEILTADDRVILAGEDIGPKGGVYGATAGLAKTFGHNRVINSLLDETSILGLAIGAANNGFIPIVEIQFLAYLHNAEDQLRGEAATLSFFSDGQITNGMVVRIAGLGYQRGFGGHFHNDNSLAVLRDIPGLILGIPARGADAVLMLREAVELAAAGRVVVIVEPIARYATRDLLTDGDGLYLDEYPNSGEIKLGEIGYTPSGADITIVTYGNGVFLARQAAADVADEINVDVMDMRWISPLPVGAIHEALPMDSKIIILDECRRTGSPSEELFTRLVEAGRDGRYIKRITADDCFIPLGTAAVIPLPSREEIVAAIKQCYAGLK